MNNPIPHAWAGALAHSRYLDKQLQAHPELLPELLATWMQPLTEELLLAPLKGLATGNAHSCVVTADGAALCWGLNYYGELGDGTTVNRPVPTPVSF